MRKPLNAVQQFTHTHGHCSFSSLPAWLLPRLARLARLARLFIEVLCLWEECDMPTRRPPERGRLGPKPLLRHQAVRGSKPHQSGLSIRSFADTAAKPKLTLHRVHCATVRGTAPRGRHRLCMNRNICDAYFKTGDHDCPPL
jgi:hypothetical protein